MSAKFLCLMLIDLPPARTNCTSQLYGNYFCRCMGLLLWNEVPDLYSVIDFVLFCWQRAYRSPLTQRQSENDSTQ